MMLMPIGRKRDLKDPIDQLPFLGTEINDFIEEAHKLGYRLEILPSKTRGWCVTLQARQDDELTVHAEHGIVTRIY